MRTLSARSRVLYAALAIVAASLGSLAIVERANFDFIAFSCAGGALDARHDPYVLGSLAACEGAIRHDDVVVPAPLPPYVLAGFGTLMRIAYPAALLGWQFLTIGLVVASAVASARLAGVSFDLAALPLLLPLLYSSLLSGQVVPLLVCGIAAAALFARRGRALPAAACATLTMVEPHVGLAVCAGLAWALPRTRVPLAVGAGALAAVSLLATGVAGNLEYFRSVLPAHAISEIDHQGQYGLAYVLHLAGLGTGLALGFGSLSYAASALAGIATGAALARRTGDAAYAVVTPATFALAGGAFIHLPQMMAAVPLALMLAREPRARSDARAALLGLAIPWGDPTILLPVSGVCAGVACALALRTQRSPAFAAAFAALTLAVVTSANAVVAAASHGDPHAFLTHAPASALAETEWQEWVHIRFTFDPVLYLFLKLPTWIALAALLRAATSLAWSTAGDVGRTPVRGEPALG